MKVPEALLEVSGLGVVYGSVTALRNVSLNVPEGGFISVLGMNGAGKSSLLWALSGAVKAASGSVRMDRHDLQGLSVHARVTAGIALVPESGRLFKKLTVQENLNLAYATGKLRGADTSDFDRAFSHFPILSERRKQLAGQLSGGEAQQLAIARGLLLMPRILLLDEPSFGLAPLVIDEVFRQLVALREEGVTILMVEQNAHKAVPISDYCYVLSHGEVEYEGPSADLLKSEKLLQAYLGEG